MNSIQNYANSFTTEQSSGADNKILNEGSNNNTNINNIWTKESFNDDKKIAKHEQNLIHNMSWRGQENKAELRENLQMEEKKDGAVKEVVVASPATIETEQTSPAHHARRPMNAFLIFCKKHRPIVREKFPNLENRGVTRILGEWWALLEDGDKHPYINLAKEYKDAFFSANPDFKWYKLPAPPLRTLSTRPGSVQKEPLFPQSPMLLNSPQESEFNPGKLADESQLGNLTSLMQSSFNKPTDNDIAPVEKVKIPDYTNNNVDISKRELVDSPPNVIKEVSMPPKPIKKRKVDEKLIDNKNIARDIFDTKSISNDDYDKITNRELVDKVVDNMFTNQNFVPQNGTKIKEPRKSERSCKGLKYIEFMANGKLMKNKRERNYPSTEVAKKDDEKVDVKIEQKLDLQQTIRRLAERTNKIIPEQIEMKTSQRVYTNSESSEDNFPKSDFNLEERISHLPTLNYDIYMQRKRESKKRKLSKTRGLHAEEPKHKVQNMASINNNNNNILIGSQKRKNKLTITHLEKKDSQTNDNFMPTDLSGLTTLAEIAANSEKIN